MKKTNRIFSFLMAVIMLFGVVSVGVFALDEQKCFLVLGDSIGYGSGLKNPGEASYGRIVADSNGYSYKNDAVPGHTTKNMLKRIAEPEVKEDIAEADIIAISIGGNNFLHSNMAKLIFEVGVLNKYTEIEKIIESFKLDFKEILSTIREYNSGVFIIVQTLYNPMPGAIHEPFEKGLAYLNSAYRECLDEDGGNHAIADVAAAFTADPELIAFDFIHPSAKGNKLIAQVILDTLKNAGFESADTIVVLTEGKDTGTKVIRKFFLAACKFANILWKVK